MFSAKIKLEDDKMCFACGTNNAAGLKLRFKILPDRTIETEFTPQKIHQGFNNIVHGGIISLILDETMLNLLWKTNKPAVTASLGVDFKKPAKVGERLIFKAHIEKEKGKIIHARSQACLEDGTVIAESKAKCFRMRPKEAQNR